jgi:hypothetical protein
MPAAAAIIPAAASVVGGKMQADAAGNAANAQTQAGRDAIQAQLAMYNQSRADTLPYQTTGTGALNLLAQLYGLPTYQGGTGSPGGIQLTGGETTQKKKKRSLFDKFTDPLNIAKQFGGTSYDPLALFSKGGGSETSPLQFSGGGAAPGGVASSGLGGPGGSGIADFSAFYQTPDYLVARDEGLRGLDRSLAARGALGSGGGDADRLQFASNLGSQAFGNFTNNLFRLAGIGGGANQQLNSLGSGFASNTGNLLGNIGDARASSYINKSNAYGNAFGQAAGAFGDYFGGRSVNQGFSPQAQGQQFGNNPTWYANIGGAGGYGG